MEHTSRVLGVFMDRSLNDFVHACEVYIEAEQHKLAPDNALTALLCDAIRLTRELTLMGDKEEERLAALLAQRLSQAQYQAAVRGGASVADPAPACPHTPPGVRGTAGYAQQHPGPYGTLPDAFYAALGEDPHHV